MPTKFQISQLNRRVSFYRNTSVSDGMGGSTDEEMKIFETWANVKQTSAKSLLLQGQDIEQSLYSVLIRYDISRLPKKNDFMEYSGMRLKIIGTPTINEEGNRKYLLFTVQTQDRENKD